MIFSFSSLLRKYAAFGGLLVFVVAGVLQYREAVRTPDFSEPGPVENKDFGDFYQGVYLPENDQGVLPYSLAGLEDRIGVNFSIISTYQAWGPRSLENFPEDFLRSTYQHGSIPMITWEPWTSTFPEKHKDPDLAANRKVFAAILRGEFDDYLWSYAKRLRDLGEPVLLRFAHEADNPLYPWSSAGGNTPAEFRAAWEYVFHVFEKAGASNVGWVWTPWDPAKLREYFPGGEYVDWVAADILNYGKASRKGQWKSFSELYEEFRGGFLAYNKPILIAELGSTPYGGDQGGWYLEALSAIKTLYPEIGGLVLFHSDQDRNWVTDWRPESGPDGIDWISEWRDPFVGEFGAALRGLGSNPTVTRVDSPHSQCERVDTAGTIQGEAGEYQLVVDGQPFYIRGVAYSPDDWHAGSVPLSRRRIEEDLSAIRSLGANTIRRYGTGWYDHNLLTIAQEQDLKVLMGFWFAPDIDYLEDEGTLRRYESEVIETIRKFNQYPAVLGWSLGNETWGLLKQHFDQPKLTRVRRAYSEFVGRLAVRIHAMDPNRPVLTVLEHSPELPGALTDFARWAPDLDVIGVNSYYQKRLAALAATMELFNPGRPYLISEFGPDGYWDDRVTQRQPTGLLEELPGNLKAEQYKSRWNQFVISKRGRNIGGIAYSWRDRLEGTSAWFGLTDHKGRKKPAYFALRSAWTGNPSVHGPVISKIHSREEEFEIGDVAEFFAEASIGEGFIFEWSLSRDEFYDTDAALESFDGGRAVRVQFPEEPGEYRLYLHLSDGAERVDTASIGLHIAPRGWPFRSQIEAAGDN